MADYKGNLCPVCENRFVEGDDIVVCPDCGTPYHRACWEKTGHCLHEAEHAAGFEWKPDFTPEETAAADAESVCPNCGFHNEPGARSCAHCGVAMPTAGSDSPSYRPSSSAGANKSGENASGDASEMFTRREIGPDDLVGGIKARDWASYVGKSSLYYLLQFIRLDDNKRKIGVSFSAFFFGPLYFFYRKMWKEGALFTLITVLLLVPNVVYLLALSESPLVSGMSFGWLAPATWICAVLDWAQMVLRSMFAMYWYKKEAGKSIRSVYASCPEDDAHRADALALRGGTSTVAAVLYVVGYFVLCFGLVALLGPNKAAVLSVLSM